MRMQIVKEAMETGNASIVTRKHDVAPSLVARWVRYYKRYVRFTRKRERREQTVPVLLSGLALVAGSRIPLYLHQR